jgi:hypothetical protein
MNIVLIVVDSLRACSLGRADGPRTPFLDRLGRQAVFFRRAYASECWTLPTHLSMFTGLLPSEHRAHFQTMAYAGTTPTLAELLAAGGHATEVVTRNTLFDGTVPGATRGFATNTRILGDLGVAAAPFAILLALGKRRVRNLLRSSGFLHALQRDSAAFVRDFARLAIPADRGVLTHALERMADHRRHGRRYFLFLNLYDVHAPYSPEPTSPLRSFGTPAGWTENVMLPWVLPRISGHAYLRPGFRLSHASRRMLVGRYHRAIELMDAKLAEFHAAARGAGLLDDTVLVITSDHGEAFGEHALYFHDASVYDTHLHVPLWVHHPDAGPAVVDDVVSTCALFDLLRAAGLGEGRAGTILDPTARAAFPVALAEHFHYPQVDGMLPRYAQDVAAAIAGERKWIVTRDGVAQYDLARDPDECAPISVAVDDVEGACMREGVPRDAAHAAAAHLRRSVRLRVAA